MGKVLPSLTGLWRCIILSALPWPMAAGLYANLWPLFGWTAAAILAFLFCAAGRTAGVRNSGCGEILATVVNYRIIRAFAIVFAIALIRWVSLFTPLFSVAGSSVGSGGS